MDNEINQENWESKSALDLSDALDEQLDIVEHSLKILQSMDCIDALGDTVPYGLRGIWPSYKTIASIGEIVEHLLPVFKEAHQINSALFKKASIVEKSIKQAA